MFLAPTFPLTPAGYFGAMVHRMLEWLTMRVRRADQGYQPVLSPQMRAQTQAIYDRLAQAGRMFARLAELARSGRLRTYPNRALPRPRDAASSGVPSGTMPHGSVQAMRGPGWMLEFVPADFAAQMARLLRLPEIVALIQTAPSVARLLRPLCRGLGVVPAPDVFPPLRPRPRRPRRRPTRDAHSPSPGALAPPRRRTRVTAADAGIQRHPRPWGGPAGSGVTPRGVEREARRDGMRQKPG